MQITPTPTRTSSSSSPPGYAAGLQCESLAGNLWGFGIGGLAIPLLGLSQWRAGALLGVARLPEISEFLSCGLGNVILFPAPFLLSGEEILSSIRHSPMFITSSYSFPQALASQTMMATVPGLFNFWKKTQADLAIPPPQVSHSATTWQADPRYLWTQAGTFATRQYTDNPVI